MNMRFMSLVLFATSAYAGFHSPDVSDSDFISAARITLYADVPQMQRALEIHTHPTSLPADVYKRAVASSSSSLDSEPRPASTTPKIRLNKTGLKSWHAAAYISWPKGARWQLEAGECAMAVRTDINPGDNDVWDLRSIPQKIVNSVPVEIASPNWPFAGGDTIGCKAMLAGLLTRINSNIIDNPLYSGSIIAQDKQHITALAIALAYNGTTYCAQAKWNGSDQLVPFISVDDIQETTMPVVVSIHEVSTDPEVHALSSKDL